MGAINCKTDPSELLNEITEYNLRPGVSFLELGDCLSKLKDSYPGGWISRVEAIGIKYRRAYYLVQVFKFCEAKGFSKEEAEDIGWTKLSVMARNKDWKKLSILAKKCTVEDLKGYVGNQKREHVAFTLPPGSKDKIDALLLNYGARRCGRGMHNKGEALLRVLFG